MENELLTLPGYRLNEYMLVLKPSEDLSEKIILEKENFHKKYTGVDAYLSTVQIPMVKFSQLQMMEYRMLNRLKSISSAWPPITIELKDYGSLPTHTIYINIATQASIATMVKNLKAAQSLLKTKEIKPHFLDNYFIPVATKLLSDIYEKAWLEYSHLNFSGKFIAKDMVLLRRPAGKKNYQVVHQFEFMNKPVISTQGALF